MFVIRRALEVKPPSWLTPPVATTFYEKNIMEVRAVEI